MSEHARFVPLQSRYSDAYAVARTIGVFGVALQYTGLGVAFLISFASIASASVSPFAVRTTLGMSHFLLAVMIVVAGVSTSFVVGTLLYLLGILTAAQGQVLKAVLDTAVNSSRTLSDDDCARILSLHTRPIAGAATEVRIPVAATSDPL